MNLADCYDRDGKPIPGDYWDTEKYTRNYKWGTERRVGRTQATDEHLVSTVWLMGIDHGFTGTSPIIFETMVFAEGHADDDNELTRYATEEDAMRGHLATVDALRAGRAPFSWKDSAGD